MKFQEKLPLPLSKVTEDLKEMGVDANVVGVRAEYDERAIGTDLVLHLKIMIEDINKERDTPETAFDRAMGLIE